ncbi:hypothetical protein FHR88_006358 [Bradyrhizobium betae]|nr:hypothetical protein [Bradyrhizobium betae]
MRQDKRVALKSSSKRDVVPAKAGTHNHREKFGEDWSFCIVTEGD